MIMSFLARKVVALQLRKFVLESLPPNLVYQASPPYSIILQPACSPWHAAAAYEAARLSARLRLRHQPNRHPLRKPAALLACFCTRAKFYRQIGDAHRSKASFSGTRCTGSEWLASEGGCRAHIVQCR
ncbi:hypothetical protein G3M48_007748 [Beauveria asiatica]|uniref:Uncharacterized protein n=1 Tax=Beauveria asiatica TaxID=1069075 RepID=A0AAW0RMA6_9HYPO